VPFLVVLVDGWSRSACAIRKAIPVTRADLWIATMRWPRTGTISLMTARCAAENSSKGRRSSSG